MPKLYTPRDAAQVLGISYASLKQWIYQRQIEERSNAGRSSSHTRVGDRPLVASRHVSPERRKSGAGCFGASADETN